MKYKFFAEISKLEQDNLLPFKYIYTSSSLSYSNTKLIRMVSEYTHPVKLSSLIHECDRIVSIVDSYIAIIKDNIVYIYNYITNRIERLPDFSSNVIKVLEVKIENIKKEINNIFIVITENIMVFYGISEDGDIVESEIRIEIEGHITAVENNNNRIYVGYEDGRVEEIIYKSGYFSSPHRIDIENNIFNMLFPIFFSKKRSPIKSLALNNNTLIVLSDKIRIYNYYKLIKEIDVDDSALEVKIMEGTFFYILHTNGRRDYYDINLLFSRKPPVEQNIIYNKLDREALITVSKKDTKAYNINIISLNEEQKVNHSKNVPLENYQLLTVDNFMSINIKENIIIILSENKLLRYEILKGPRFLLYSKIEDTYKIIRGYGEKESFVNYLYLAGDNEDVTKLDHLFTKDNYIEAIYTYIYRIIKDMYNIKIDYKFFEKGDIVISRIKNIMRNRIVRRVFNIKYNGYNGNAYDGNIQDNKEIITLKNLLTDIIESINYLKIVYEIDPSINYGITLKELLERECTSYKKSSFEKIINISTLENVLRKIRVKCSSFFPLNEIYYQKGMSLLKKESKENLENSLANFMQIQVLRDDIIEDRISSKRKIIYRENKKGESEDLLSLVKVVEEYNRLRFYIGSVMIIRNIFGGIREGVELLSTAIKCKGSLMKALEDERERFHFCVFEVILKKMENQEYTQECICCNKSIIEDFDIININSPFLEEFLKEKFETSKNLSELELLYKFYFHHKKINKGINTIISLINKNIPTEKKIELLEIGLLINNNKEMNLHLTIMKIVQEIERRTRQKILSINPDELFNNYTLPLKYTDLSLQLLDISNYNNKRILTDLWKEYLCENKYIENVNRLMRLRLTGIAMNLRIIGSILLEQIDYYNKNIKEDRISKNKIINHTPASPEEECIFNFKPTKDNITSVIKVLHSYGFNKNDIFYFVKDALNKYTHPKTKELLLKWIKEDYKDKSKEIEEEVKNTYGIECNSILY